MPANSVLAKAPYKIPVVVDTDRICISVPCPNDPDHIANFLEAIATLGLWSNYQLESDRIAKPVADVWMEIFRVVEESLCDCALRNGPSGIEQFNQHTGTWVPVQGNSSMGDPRTDGSVPPPWPTPPSGQTGNCLAAANIVGVFQSMQEDAAARLEISASFATLLVGIESFLDLALPLIGEVIQIATEMAAGALDAGATVFAAAFDPATQTAAYHGLQCALSCHIASDGTVTAGDITDAQNDFLAALPGYVSNPAENLLWQIFVPDFLASQGPNGLMKMARLSNISSADCSDCTGCLWTHVFDFTLSDGGWTTDPAGLGVYEAAVGWRDTLGTGGSPQYRGAEIVRTLAATTIRKITVEFSFSAGELDASGDNTFQIFTSAGAFNSVAIPTTPPSPQTWIGSHSMTSIGVVVLPGVRIFGGDPGGTCNISKITITGEGTDPF